jgi:hypothetical protein
MRFAAFWMALLLMPLMCLANTEDSVNTYLQQQETKRVESSAKLPTIVEQYGKSLGCSFSMEPRNIVSYTLDEKPVLLAVFELDVGCSGKPGATRPIIVALRQSTSGEFFIDADYSMPKQSSTELPHHIHNLFIRSNDLWYQGLTFKAADASCCPTLDVTGRIAFEDGVWKEHQRMPLERSLNLITP